SAAALPAPKTLSVEASADGGATWHNITGGGGALAINAVSTVQPRGARHRYPVTLAPLREAANQTAATAAAAAAAATTAGEGLDAAATAGPPQVTHLRLLMHG
ncbi:unnamed protein product, partial [Phaeothamnion confervicola]